MKPLFVLTNSHAIRNIIWDNFEHQAELTDARKIFTWGYSQWSYLRGPVVPAIYVEARAQVYLTAELRGLIEKQEEKGAKIVWLR